MITPQTTALGVISPGQITSVQVVDGMAFVQVEGMETPVIVTEGSCLSILSNGKSDQYLDLS